MPRSFELPAADHEQFSRPPLKAMLGQVRFPPILRAADVAALGGLQENLAKQGFTEFGEQQQLAIAIGPQGLAQAPAERSFRFATEAQDWSVLLAPSVLTLEAEAGKYTNFEVFCKRFSQAWAAAVEHLRPTKIVQQGLRYIDHIEKDLSAREWTKFVNPALVGFIAEDTFSSRMRQSISDYRFELEGGNLIFKHGIVPAGPEQQPGYLLDFDCFTHEELVDVSVDAVIARFEVFHDELYPLFRWCVTDEALEEFRGTSD